MIRNYNIKIPTILVIFLYRISIMIVINTSDFIKQIFLKELNTIQYSMSTTGLEPELNFNLYTRRYLK